MAFLDSPGVKISEVDLSTTIPTEGVSDAAFVGTGFTWGPIDEVVTVSSEKELVRIFGKPTKDTSKDWFTAASFLAYGGILQIIRQENPIFTYASSGGEANTVESDVIANSNPTEIDDVSDFTGATVVLLGGSIADDWTINITTVVEGAITVATVGNNPVDETVTDFITRVAGGAGDDLAVVKITNNTSVVEVLYGGSGYTAGTAVPALDQEGGDFSTVGTYTYGSSSETNNIIETVTLNLNAVPAVPNGTKILVTAGENYTKGYVVISAEHASIVNAHIIDGNLGSTVKAAARHAGTSGNNLKVKVELQPGGDDTTYLVTVTDSSDSILETYNNLSYDNNAKDIFGNNINVLEVINEKSEYIYVGSSLSGVTNFTLLGGTSTALTSGNTYNEFQDTDRYDVDLIIGGSDVSSGGSALICANTRADCIAFVSPKENSTSAVLASNDRDTYYTSYLSSFGFMDSGSKKMYDKYNDTYVTVPLNGDIAGLCVRTDNTREPWYSPAGFNRGQLRNVVSLTYDPSQSDRDVLYQNNINPVSTFPGQGVVLFGDKTLQTKSSAFDRINVRRLFNIIEKTIKDVAKYSLFEFNDEFTRAQFRSIITPYLRDIQARRGITDFLVVCDDTNNPANIIDSNQFIGDIFIKPTRSVNFIQLNFVAVSTGVSFNEVVGAV